MTIIPPSDPAGVAEARLRDLERRMSNMETARSAQFTSIYDDAGNLLGQLSADGLQFFDPASGLVTSRIDGEGLTVFDGDGDPITTLGADGLAVLDASGAERMTIGKLGSTDYGMSLVDSTGAIELTRVATDETSINDKDGTPLIQTDPQIGGLIHPEISAPSTSTDEYRYTTSSAFEAAWEAYLGRVYHETVVAVFSIFADPGTTGEIMVEAGAPTSTTSTLSIPSGGFGSLQSIVWLHGLPLNDGDGSRWRVLIRRTGGTGNVGVKLIGGLNFRSVDRWPVPTTNGWDWVP